MDLLYSYPARRSAVISQRGMVTTSQPLATAAGADVLAAGGNAIDAAVATTAALNVVQPSATGIGGDLFAQVYIKQSGELMALNGSGRAPYAASPDAYRDLGYREMPARGIHAVTVPGAVDGWCVLLQKYGTLSLERVLAPAIRLAETGFPVTTVAQRFWQMSAEKLRTDQAAARNYLIDGRVPEVAEVFRQPDLAATQVLISVGGMLLGGMVPMMFTLLVEFPDVRPDYIGGVAGMTGAVSNLGGILLPLVVVAPIVTAGGAGAYSLAFMIVAIIALCALPAALLIKETYGVRVRPAPDRSPDVMP